MAVHEGSLLEYAVKRGLEASADRGRQLPDLDGVPYKVVRYPHDGSVEFQFDLTDVDAPTFGAPLGYLARQIDPSKGGMLRYCRTVDRDFLDQSRLRMDNSWDAELLNNIVRATVKHAENQISQEAQEKGISLDTSPPAKIGYEYDLADVTTFNDPYRQTIPVRNDRPITREEGERQRQREFEKMRWKEAERRREHEANKRELEAIAKEQAEQEELEFNELYGEWA